MLSSDQVPTMRLVLPVPYAVQGSPDGKHPVLVATQPCYLSEVMEIAECFFQVQGRMDW